MRGNETIDELKSYFGLRRVTIEGRRILINGKPIFQRLMLDQGFYPDGIWTAPSDEALKHDIEMSMACGFDGARLHQKVFEPRFLYWADKMGYLVWGEFPNWGYNYKARRLRALCHRMDGSAAPRPQPPGDDRLVPFQRNRGARRGNSAGDLERDQGRRPDASGVGDERLGPYACRIPRSAIRTTTTAIRSRLRKRWMDYFGPASAGSSMPPRYGFQPDGARDSGVPFMISEIGGIGWATEGGWGYGEGPKTLEAFYARYRARSTPCWTTRTCSDSATRN